MGSAFSYSPRPGPLGSARPVVAALYLAPLAVAAFAFSNPVLLAGVGAAAVAVAIGSAALGAALGPLRFGLSLALMVVLVNGLASQRGETILVRGWELPLLGSLDISAEALAEGAVLALRILVVLVVFALWSACVDPDRVLRAIRPIAARSALTGTLIARLVPLAAADLGRLSEAGSLRGPAAAPVGRAALARRLIAGSLDRSVDVAATLELRGYGLPARRAGSRRPLQPDEWGLLGAAALLGATVAAAALLGVGSFQAYPVIRVTTAPATFAVAALLVVFAASPFLLAGGGRRRATHD